MAGADGAEFTATLVPIGGVRHRPFLDALVREAIGKSPGDSVEIRARFDPSDRMPELPASLLDALRDCDALDAWRALRPPRRKECLPVLADAKREQTRRRRIARIAQAALGEASSRRR
ncbi:MAG: DUF1905 domain-containing protein [Thermoleophilia bacterium]|nr:DUF1905 domain-containing protein [Thermoleophilia bacterium]